MSKPLKIAIVGSGISGMTCAHVLSREHEVDLFETGSTLGGHTATVDVTVASGHYAIDTGFIVFNDWTYPNFIRLMDTLGVASDPTAMSFSVKSEKSGLEYNGTDLNRLFIQRSNLFKPSFHQMIFDILRFNRESPKLLDHAGEEISLASFLKEGRYSKGFIENYIIPMGAAIWSSSAEQMLDFPARFFVRFFKNHGMLSVDERPQWRVIRGGSRSYIAPLCAPFKDRIHLNSPVRQVTRLADGVKIKLDGGEKTFDHVIFASHSDQTLSALGDATTLEREVLKGFAYQPNEVVLHTDISVLPKRKKAWAAWNYLIPHHAQSKVSVTYNMNILQGLTAPETFSVSLNMGNQINPAKVLKRFIYDHPVYSIRSVISQNQWAQISQGRTHFCGAYWGNGFHEDGVASALKVCKEGFGAL